jgi:hypothetical protein
MGVIKFEELEVSLIFGGKKTEEETKVSLRRFSKFDFENSESQSSCQWQPTFSGTAHGLKAPLYKATTPSFRTQSLIQLSSKTNKFEHPAKKINPKTQSN